VGLLVSGEVAPNRIAIATTVCSWDGNFHALTGDARLPLHFSDGISVLATSDGQRCAALADLLLNGLSRERVVRLLGLAKGRRPSSTRSIRQSSGPSRREPLCSRSRSGTRLWRSPPFDATGRSPDADAGSVAAGPGEGVGSRAVWQDRSRGRSDHPPPWANAASSSST
jgi:hypothetical protein